MTIFVDNVERTSIFVNGTKMERVYLNGSLVYTRINGGTTMVCTGDASGTFDPGEEDIDRHFFVISGRFSANSLSAGPIPVINGIPCDVILNDVDNGNNDGGRIGMFKIKIPIGTGSFSISNADSVFAVYRVVGITTATPYSTAQNSGGASIEITAPAKGITFVVGVRNFSTAPPITGADTDLRYSPGNPAVGGARTNATSPQTLTFSGDYSQMMRAASFSYDNLI